VNEYTVHVTDDENILGMSNKKYCVAEGIIIYENRTSTTDGNLKLAPPVPSRSETGDLIHEVNVCPTGG
jgi:hypothetical protein